MTVALNGVASEAVPDAGEGVPLVQVTLTGTDAPLFGTKSLFTVSVALFRVFVIVQEDVPFTVMATFTQFAWLAVYPAGTVSVAVQVAPTVKPVTATDRGVASLAWPLEGEGVPLVQLRLTLTVAALLGMKSLLIVSVAAFCEFVIVQEPLPDGAPEIEPVQVPLEV